MKRISVFMIWIVTGIAARSVADDAASEIAVPSQPLLAQVHRLSEALDVVGSPLSQSSLLQLSKAKQLDSPKLVAKTVQGIFDPMCLAVVDVQASGPPVISLGSAKPALLEQGWRTFLVKVINRHGRTGRLFVESPNARPLPYAPLEEVESRWMQISSFDGQPMRANLSGLALEYRIIQIYSRDPGRKMAMLEFNVTGDPDGDRDLIREWRFDKDTDGWNEMNQISLPPAVGGPGMFGTEGKQARHGT